MTQGAGSFASSTPSLNISSSGLTGYLVFVTLSAALSSFNFGYNISVVDAPGAIFALCEQLHSLPEGTPIPSGLWSKCFVVTERLWGVVAAMLCVGALIGSLVGGKMADRIGRKSVLIYNNFFYLLGLSLATFSTNLWMLLAGRLFVGIGAGIACIVVPMYLTEIATVHIRGVIGSGHQMAIVTGIVVAELIGYGLARPTLWRLMFALDGLVCLAQIILLPFCVESPCYLALRGRQEEAIQSLERLRPLGYVEGPPRTYKIEPEVLEDTRPRMIPQLSLRTLFFRTPSARKSLIVGIALHWAQQFSGINGIFFFASLLFADPATAKSLPLKPSLVPVGITGLNMLMTIVALWLIDRTGRRFLALLSCSLMAISGAVLTGAFLLDSYSAKVVFLLLFVAAFAIGLGPVPWLLLNEIFPTNALAAAASVAVSVNWISNLIVSASFPSLYELLGNWVFAPFSIIVAFFSVFVYFMLPETKGREVAYL